MIRLRLCGCGTFVRRGVMPQLRKIETIEIAGVYDANANSSKDFANTFNISRIYSTYDEMLNDKSVDAVYICIPNVFHKDHAIQAADAGKHIFCEKPMAMNAGECRQMVEAVEKNNVKFAIGFCYPLAGPQQKAKQLIDDGAIDEISHIHISFNLGGYNKETAGWRCDPKFSGGGPLMDLAPHLIHLACFFYDDKVKSVMAYVNPKKSETEIEMDARILLEFSNNKIATIDTSFIRGNMHHYDIVGKKGLIHAFETMCWQVGGTMQIEKDFKRSPVEFEPIEGIEREFRIFTNAIETDRQPFATAYDGLHIQSVIDAIYESDKTASRINIIY